MMTGEKNGRRNYGTSTDKELLGKVRQAGSTLNLNGTLYTIAGGKLLEYLRNRDRARFVNKLKSKQKGENEHGKLQNNLRNCK